MDDVPGLDLSQPPFDLLDEAGRARLAAGIDLGYQPAGTLLIEAGQPSPHVMVVLKGRIHAFDLDHAGHERRFGDYGPGDVFGAWAVMAGRARHSYRSQTDALLYLIPAPLFTRLLGDYPAFSAWFNEGLSAKGRMASRGSDIAELMATRVGDAQLAPAERMQASATIREASQRLSGSRVDCLLVDDPAHAGPAIVTRTDLLEALTLGDATPESRVGPLANRPLVAVRAEEVLFQALVVMTERHIERVAVREGEAIIGTLGMAEVLSHYASHSHLISLRLARAGTLAEVTETARGMHRLIRTLHAQGARIPYLMELVSALNTRVMQRIFELVIPREYQSQACLLVLGSEGRREQLLKTDQDNALVFADGTEWPVLAESMQHFSDALRDAGYPPCPGKVMVSNPHWRMPVEGWRRRVDELRWLHTAEAALDLAIMLDARAIAGNTALFDPLAESLSALGGDERLLHQLASSILQFDTPLNLLGQLKGAAQGTDLKKGGIFPIVHGLRCLALKHGIAERNSYARCAALVERGLLSAELGRDLPQAFCVFQRLRLDAQLDAIDAQRPLDSHVQAERLRRLDRELLRDALRVVKDFRVHIKQSFHLEG